MSLKGDSRNPFSPDYQGPVMTIGPDGKIDLVTLPRKTLTWRKKFRAYIWLVQAVCDVGMRHNDRIYPIVCCTCFKYAREQALLHHGTVLDEMYAVSTVHVTRIAKGEAEYFNTMQLLASA